MFSLLVESVLCELNPNCYGFITEVSEICVRLEPELSNKRFRFVRPLKETIVSGSGINYHILIVLLI